MYIVGILNLDNISTVSSSTITLQSRVSHAGMWVSPAPTLVGAGENPAWVWVRVSPETPAGPPALGLKGGCSSSLPINMSELTLCRSTRYIPCRTTGKIMVVITPGPHGDETWASCCKEAAEVVKAARPKCRFQAPNDKKSRARGDISNLHFGISIGNGQKVRTTQPDTSPT
jgi:hypothetical protein